MTRAWRIEYEGALYHVLSRGNEKQNIVTNDNDHNLFLATAGEMAGGDENPAPLIMMKKLHESSKYMVQLTGACLKAIPFKDEFVRNQD